MRGWLRRVSHRGAGCRRPLFPHPSHLLADLEHAINFLIADPQMRQIDSPIVETTYLDIQSGGYDGGDQSGD